MYKIDDSELRRIVQKTVSQALGISNSAGTSVPSPIPTIKASKPESSLTALKTVAVGADHGGFDLKEQLKPFIKELGFEIFDVGTFNKESVDYPDFAHKTAELVSLGKACRGIMIDGAGIGSCIVANKVPGVRAGMAYDYSTAVNSREHNNTNVLTLGAGLIGSNLAKQIVKTWLTTEFGGGRHAPRVDKITAVEKQYTK